MNKKTKPVSSIAAKRRALIMSAALKEFAENGYKGASVQKIADVANLSKSNVLYYFTSKKRLYSEIMQSILSMWNSSFDNVTSSDCPAHALANYIAEKMEISRTNPYSSKVFAIEIINGSPNLDPAFKREHKLWVQDRIKVIEGWIAAKKIDNINPEFLLYQIWSSTQYYADFSSQIENLHGSELSKQAYAQATDTVVKLILKGCGLEVPHQY
jgi:TetR/AcrR family transcriptional regulator